LKKARNGNGLYVVEMSESVSKSGAKSKKQDTAHNAIIAMANGDRSAATFFLSNIWCPPAYLLSVTNCIKEVSNIPPWAVQDVGKIILW